MDELARSWNAFGDDVANGYLVSHGNPSPNSKRILIDVLRELFPHGEVRLLDLGCGNANLFPDLANALHGLLYTGVDFSEPLLSAAKAATTGSSASFIHSDVNTLEAVSGRYDVAVYSHVIEMLGSPERSLIAASKLAKKIVIRFFEPPEFEFDSVELRPLEFAEGKFYIRRKIGRDYYRLMLSRAGCRAVDVYQDETARDQIHVLHLGGKD